jgi:UDP-4-amino-4,6-dideoxy-N-acetyl-beta-L-altrosamine N-acetyltransferase
MDKKIIRDIEFENISLKKLTREYLDDIFVMRNSEQIRRCMVHQEIISWEDHLEWYERISQSDNDFYWVILYESEVIGLVNLKDIDWDKKNGEAGIFIGKPEYHNSFISFTTNILFLDFAFFHLRLKKIKATILKSNKRAIRFNMMFGFQVISEEPIVLNQAYDVKCIAYLNEETYFKKRNSIAKVLNMEIIS